MRQFRWILMAATVMLSTGAGVVGEPASASESDDTSDVFGQTLDEFLTDYPNAERRADGSYQLEPGVVLVPPSSAPSSEAGTAEQSEWPSDCWDNWVCAWQHAEFEGWGIRWYDCATVSLNPPYSNSISSMHNAQNSHTAWFADVGQYPRQGTLGPNSYWRNMTVNSWNDRIDLVDPC